MWKTITKKNNQVFKTARLVRPDRGLVTLIGVVRFCYELYDIEWYYEILSIFSDIFKYLQISSKGITCVLPDILLNCSILLHDENSKYNILYRYLFYDD